MLEMKAVDTVVPTVYRVGRTSMIQDVPSDHITAARSPMVPSVQETVMPSASLIGELVPSINVLETGLEVASPQQLIDLELHGSPADFDDFKTPEPSSPALSAQPLLTQLDGEMTQSTTVPVTTHLRSLAALLNGYQSSSPTRSSTLAESMSSLDLSHKDATPAVDSTTTKAVTAPLKASFVADATVPDGQVFPPGAEFMKSWRVINDGTHEWPETSELHFTGGEKLWVDTASPQSIAVGKVAAGMEVDVWTGELKVIAVVIL